MRIACVQSFPIDYCLDFVNAIAPIGDISFLAAEQDMRDKMSFLDSRVELKGLEWPRHRSLANINLLRQMSNFVRSRDVDLVHFLGDDVTWLNLLPYLIGRRATTITVHDAEPHPGDIDSDLMPKFVIDQFNRRGTRLIVHGETIKTALIRRIGRSPNDIDVIPHVALLRYAEIAKRENLKPAPRDGARNILFFGRIMTYKGLPILAEAGRLAKKALPQLKLVVAGRGPALDDVRPDFADDHVELLDYFIPDKDVAQLFLDAEVVVLPYIEASQSGILALAAAFGRPVIVTDVGALGEIVRSTGMGLVVPPSDAEALSEAIGRVLSEPDLAGKLSEASAEAATGSSLMSYRHVADGARNTYQKAMETFARLKQQAG